MCISQVFFHSDSSTKILCLSSLPSILPFSLNWFFRFDPSNDPWRVLLLCPEKVIYVQLLELAPALKCHYAAVGMSGLTYHVYQTWDCESEYNPWILFTRHTIVSETLSIHYGATVAECRAIWEVTVWGFMVRNTEIISSSDTLVDELPYASTAQRYILQVQISYHARFEVLASVLKIHVVRDMTRCRLVHSNRCLGLACCLHLQSSPRTIDCHEYEDASCCRNVVNYM
jgi:hypothetical protein